MAGRITLSQRLDPKRLFRQPLKIVLPIGALTDDTIETVFVPISRIKDYQEYTQIIRELSPVTEERLREIAEDPDMQELFDPLFKAVCPNLTAVGDWKDLNVPAKLIILDAIAQSES